MQQLSQSLFSSAKDNQPKPKPWDVSQFATPLVVPDGTDKESGPAWSPCTYNGTRAHKNVIDGSAFALVYDFDRGADGLEGVEPEVFQQILQGIRNFAIVHTTFSDGYFAPRRKFRVIYPLETSVSTELWIKLWHEHNKFPCSPDTTKIHPGNLFFLPRVEEKHRQSFFHRVIEGPPLPTTVGLFAGVDLNSAETAGPRDWVAHVRNAREKDNALRSAANGLGASLAWADVPLAEAQDRVWEKLEPALKANPHGAVKDWFHARRTSDGGVAHVYARVAEEREAAAASGDPLASLPTPDSANEKLIAAAQKVLEKWEKKVRKSDAELSAAAFFVGQFVPHAISEDRVREALLAAWKACKTSTLAFSDAETALAAGIAKGKLKPKGALPNWGAALKLDNEGRPLASDENVHTVLRDHEDMQGVLGYDERKQQHMIRKAPPWPMADDNYPTPLLDHHAYDIARWVADILGTAQVGWRKALDAAWAVAAESRYDVFRDYLDALSWDGAPRLDTWVQDLANVPDEPLFRAQGAAWMIAAVARTYQPGCKVDNMLVFVGEQGAQKSSLFRALLPYERDLFTDNPGDIHDKDIHLTMSRVVISEMAEMSGFSKKDVEAIKSFITGGYGKVRPAYARAAQDFPRRGVLCGTTNQAEFLRDVTGNRRFWPMPSSSVDLARAAASRDQLWAEAVHRYKKGEKWWLSTELEEEAKKIQEDARVKDSAEEEFLAIMEEGIPAGRRKPYDPHGEFRSVDSAERVMLWFFDDQMDGDRLRYVTIPQVCEILGWDRQDKRTHQRARELLIACKYRLSPDRIKRAGAKHRVWIR